MLLANPPPSHIGPAQRNNAAQGGPSVAAAPLSLACPAFAVVGRSVLAAAFYFVVAASHVHSDVWLPSRLAQPRFGTSRIYLLVPMAPRWSEGTVGGNWRSSSPTMFILGALSSLATGAPEEMVRKRGRSKEPQPDDASKGPVTCLLYYPGRE